MNIKQTHTYSILEISRSAYDEIKDKLIEAGYQHAVMKEGEREVIDMHGIAIAQEDGKLDGQGEFWQQCKSDTMPEVGTPLLIRVWLNQRSEYFLAIYIGNDKFRIETRAELLNNGAHIKLTSSMHSSFVTHWTYITEP